MRETLEDLEWRPNAAKMVVLVADAPPHGQLLVAPLMTLTSSGIGEYGDGFPEGSPDGQ